jgi:hypothetical protein
LPAEALGRRHEDVARARIGELAQPERERILPAGNRELVHDRLDREHVRVGAQRAQR